MRSKLHLKGHPLHPILVSFPLAFFTGALIFDILGLVQDNRSFWTTGSYLALAGIIGGLLAAIPGIADYLLVVPPNSSAKKRGAKHGLLNVLVIGLFAAAYFYRRGEESSPTIILSLEAAGFVLMGISGWLGGTLVHRNQISVDHRYARSGKWKEKHLQRGGDMAICGADDLEVDQMMLVHVDGKRIVVARTGNGFAAFDDGCTHRGGSLADGVMICGTVQCPWHGAQFDVHTGMVKAGPADRAIATYAIQVREGKIFLDLPGASAS